MDYRLSGYRIGFSPPICGERYRVVREGDTRDGERYLVTEFTVE